MKGVKVPHLISIAAACWLALICFQVMWIKDSHDLIEEQFDQKVTLALCAAVGSLDTSTVLACSAPGGGVQNELNKLGLLESTSYAGVEIDERLYNAVDEALAFYDIDLKYQIELTEASSPSCDPASPYCCAINPFEQTESALMSIVFPGKNAYLLKKMWVMLASSIFILLFILAVFVLAVRSLVLQKRMSQWNIDFFNNMAHEFRTPLTNIRLALQRLTKKYPEINEETYVDIIRREDAKLSTQIEGVLNLANYETGGGYLNPQKLRLSTVLTDVLGDMDLQIQQAGAIVKFNGTNDDIQVLGDKFHLSRAFRNLLDNALKYADSQPVIDIELQQRENEIAVIFDDNGRGIPKSEREMIFNKYHRVSNGDLHDQKGFGLGLSYVKMIVQDHKGNIRVLNKSKKGSQFELTLPIAQS